jgi:membrane protein DedA with SNARE-associated domain
MGGVTEWVTDVVEALGYLGVAFLVALENVFPPIPSEVVLPLAGFVAGQGRASLPGMIAAATIGSVVGAWILYGISALLGPQRLHRFVARYGRWMSVSTDELARAEAWFDRRAAAAVLVCRCVPLIRSLVSIPAGFRRMEPIRFTIYTAAGSAVWNTALVGAGFLLGERWESVGDYVGVLQWMVIMVIAGLAAWFAWRKIIQPRWGAPARAERRAATSRADDR